MHKMIIILLAVSHVALLPGCDKFDPTETQRQLLSSQLQDADTQLKTLDRELEQLQSNKSSLEQRLRDQEATLRDYRQQVQRYMMNHKMALAAIAAGVGGTTGALASAGKISDGARVTSGILALVAVMWASNNMPEVIEVTDQLIQAGTNVDSMESGIAETREKLKQAQLAMDSKQSEIQTARSGRTATRTKLAALG